MPAIAAAVAQAVAAWRPEAAPETAVRFTGNGSNIIYIDWDNDLVAVFRWIAGDGLNNSVEKIIASLKAPAKTSSSAGGQ